MWSHKTGPKCIQTKIFRYEIFCKPRDLLIRYNIRGHVTEGYVYMYEYNKTSL